MFKSKIAVFVIAFVAFCHNAYGEQVGLTVDGAFNANVENATGQLFFNERIGIWMLQVRSPREYKKQNGTGFTATLFFSKDFAPRTGEFPIKFNYLSRKDTLGGSLIASGKARAMFSHDTAGKVVFSKFDQQVKGSFEFSAFDGSKEPRREVKVKGVVECPREGAFE